MATQAKLLPEDPVKKQVRVVRNSPLKTVVKKNPAAAKKAEKKPEEVDYRDLLKNATKKYNLKVGQVVRFEINDDHFYFIVNKQFPKGKYLPGVTTLLGEAAPKGYGLIEFWKNNTKEDSEAILQMTGNFGTKIHDAAEQLLNGVELNLHRDYASFQEQRTLMSFASWFKAALPKNFQSEQVIASSENMYAGTLDFVGQIERRRAAVLLGLNVGQTKELLGDDPEKLENWIIDFKTSSGIRYDHQLQVIAYRKAYEESYGVKIDRIGVLRLGAKSKRGFEFKEVFGGFERFQNVYKVYLDLHNGVIPDPPELAVFPETLQLYESEDVHEPDANKNNAAGTKRASVPVPGENNKRPSDRQGRGSDKLGGRGNVQPERPSQGTAGSPGGVTL